MAKIHLLANTYQTIELFKVVADYGVSEMSLTVQELEISALFI